MDDKEGTEEKEEEEENVFQKKKIRLNYLK